MPPAVAIVVPVTAIVCIVGLLALLRKFDNDERMAMIEKGLTPPQKDSMRVNPASALRWGCLFMGVGLGIFIANIFQSASDKDSEALYPASILFFGGLGLLFSYYIQLKLDERHK
ncbi:DUF6249 domain-containing protein [Emticicia sp. C21]|uniref:DUF6249 domain-containing protein n=1 Tax=Emticicia sp. C21 TaxID=2302915 RepID=UPI000E3466EB|nr:DUF6249 domain-containing protein [Emticicia sp. C21]RFS13687.1 hypothetical protein D0T08_25210 [Emticicia sp. C21]